MKSLIVIISLFALLSATAYAYPYRVIENTYILSELTLPIAKAEIRNLAVYLHDPSCLPCKAFLQQFREASEICSSTVNDPENFNFAYIDVGLESQIPKDLDVFHFPTLIFYKNGQKYHTYDGPIQAKVIFDWAYSNYELPFEHLEKDNPSNIFGDHDLAVIYLGEKDEENTNKILEGAKKYKEYVHIFRTENDFFRQKYNGIDWGSWLLLHRYNDQTWQAFGKSNTARKGFEDVLNEEVAKLPKVFDAELAKTMEETRNVFYIYFSKSGLSDFEERSAFFKAYNQLKINRVLFLRADVSTSLGATLAGMFGIKEDQLPTVGILDSRKEVDQKYVLTQDIKVSDLLKFYEDTVLNQRNQLRLSENIGDLGQKDKDHITTISRDYFLDLIKQNNKKLLVLFCAPLEYQCRMFENTYKSLAYKLKDHDDIIVAKADITKNDVDIKIEDLPALAWYSSEYKDGMRYKGQYNIIYIKRWLKRFGIEFDD